MRIYKLPTFLSEKHRTALVDAMRSRFNDARIEVLDTDVDKYIVRQGFRESEPADDTKRQAYIAFVDGFVTGMTVLKFV